jgi:hypothetical protein
MRIEMKVALIGLAGAIGGAILGAVLPPVISHALEVRDSGPARAVLEMNSKWKATWYNPDNSVYAEDDIVTLEKWTKGAQFSGTGDVKYPTNPSRYRYSISGEVAPNRLVVLVYKAEKFPAQAHFGTAFLLISNDGRTMTGYWLHQPAGHFEPVPGRVKLERDYS